MDKIMFYANNSQLVIGPVTKHRLPEGYTRLLFTHADSEYQILIDSKSPHLSRIQSIIRNIRLNEATIDYLERKMRRTRPRT